MIKLKIVPCLILFCMAAMLIPGGNRLWAADSETGKMHATTQFAYPPGPGDTPRVAHALALYGAKYEAVLRLGRRLADQGLLKDYADKRLEIFCIVADELKFKTVAESVSENDGTVFIRIESRGALADFVKAEIKNAALEKKEMEFSWQEEMEPVLSSRIEPGLDLSRAYRYIRRQHWRKAIIYLDQLEKKYPSWSDLFFAKGLGYEKMHETRQAQDAFRLACERGRRDACNKMAPAASEE